MQFPESWLRAFCNPPLTSQQLADTLTMAGLEVEELHPVAPRLFQSGGRRDPECGSNSIQCRSTSRLPGGRGAGRSALNIVCGAPNARVGIKVPCALVGALNCHPVMMASRLQIKLGQAAWRRKPGHAVFGASELKLSEDHATALLELPGDDALVGRDIREQLSSRRHAVHAQAHAEPGALPQCLWHRARSGSALTGSPLVATAGSHGCASRAVCRTACL